MPAYICVTCGVQFADSDQPPSICKICEDERQYVGYAGQQWVTQDQLSKTRVNRIELLEPNLYGIGSVPSFAIGQRALLMQSPHGNVLWDCMSLLDADTIARVNALGGISKIVISHPHFYATVADWAEAFDAPVYLHAADQAWLMRPHENIQFLEGDVLELQPGITIQRVGGHFDGCCVCHWADGAAYQGALLTGDSIYVVSDRRWVSFMHSFPNLIPLPASKVAAIAQAVERYKYSRLYSGWWQTVVDGDAAIVVQRSAQRYIAAITD